MKQKLNIYFIDIQGYIFENLLYIIIQITIKILNNDR